MVINESAYGYNFDVGVDLKPLKNPQNLIFDLALREECGLTPHFYQMFRSPRLASLGFVRLPADSSGSCWGGCL